MDAPRLARALGLAERVGVGAAAVAAARAALEDAEATAEARRLAEERLLRARRTQEEAMAAALQRDEEARRRAESEARERRQAAEVARRTVHELAAQRDALLGSGHHANKCGDYAGARAYFLAASELHAAAAAEGRAGGALSRGADDGPAS